MFRTGYWRLFHTGYWRYGLPDMSGRIPMGVILSASSFPGIRLIGPAQTISLPVLSTQSAMLPVTILNRVGTVCGGYWHGGFRRAGLFTVGYWRYGCRSGSSKQVIPLKCFSAWWPE